MCIRTAIVAMLLLVAGCASEQWMRTKTGTMTISRGQDVSCYRLVNVDSQGRAEFRNMDTGDHDMFVHILAGPGQMFAITQGKSRYEYKVGSADPVTQEAIILFEYYTRH